MFKYLMSSLMSTYENQDPLDTYVVQNNTYQLQRKI